MENYLSRDADIVLSKHFENAVVKVLMNQESLLSPHEKNAIKHLKFEQEPELEVENPGANRNANSIVTTMRKNKRARHMHSTSSKSAYVDLNFVVGTSDIVERLFSAAGLILTDLRSSMLPINAEALLFLKVNRMYWDFETVMKIC